MTRLVETNQLLNKCSPFILNQALLQDELHDIAKLTVPVTWQKIMVLHGVDPMEHRVNEFIEFYEWLEFSKGIDP